MNIVCERLNQLLADTSVLYAKIQNYHWNVKGVQFYAIHAKTEALYNIMTTMRDDLAERIIQIGGTPIVTLKGILQKTRIKEEENIVFDAKCIVQNILKDFEFFHKEFVELSNLEGVDIVTGNYAQDQLAFLEKEIWMMRAFLTSVEC
ncbi:MAG: Dps family protein [Desulfovibrionaceae bacterium]